MSEAAAATPAAAAKRALGYAHTTTCHTETPRTAAVIKTP
jgi:hypothetical protein